ncbi:MAG: phospho-N-acetylmuramoyl-pentapeptide-transferase [Clostridia bacterium]
MSDRFIVCLIIAFVTSLLLAPIVISLSKKFKLSQTILHYVEAHKQKEGTPTMGGFIFIIAIIFSSLICIRKDFSLGIICLAVMLGFGIIGFLDDYIKIKYKQNLGLKPYQKIIGQTLLAVIVAIFAYSSNLVGSEILLPFSKTYVDFGVFIIPFIVLVFLALTNSVNLIDGLDGLSSGVSLSYIVSFIFIFGASALSMSTISGVLAVEYQNLMVVACACAGGLVGFLCFNAYPAKIFMGDTGSLALGGLLSCISVFSKTELLIPIIGVMFVVTAVSDIIQVAYFKKTKKRVFLMAPLHHHFEKKGVHENRIVLIYILITAVVGMISFLLTKNFAV